MNLQIEPATADEILPLRTRHRAEMNCQIVHDSIHRREGWTHSHLFRRDGIAIGFCSVAIGGPWKDKPTLFEFYLLPEHQACGFDCFEALRKTGSVGFFEVQTHERLLTVILHAYGRNIVSEKIVFWDQHSTDLRRDDVVLRCLTPDAEVRENLNRRQGGGEWVLELSGEKVASGGILFHYNRPYGDIYMEVEKDHRQKGLGSYLVQELKRCCYELGAIPAARCNPDNTASRRCLQRAGFLATGHILLGEIIPA
jgi:GNAT superfamily N-acetyltransferase